MKRFLFAMFLVACCVVWFVMQSEARRGCCSHHGGVCGCSHGRAVCCDGSYSPSCGCD